MAERNQQRRLLGRHDSGEPSRTRRGRPRPAGSDRTAATSARCAPCTGPRLSGGSPACRSRRPCGPCRARRHGSSRRSAVIAGVRPGRSRSSAGHRGDDSHLVPFRHRRLDDRGVSVYPDPGAADDLGECRSIACLRRPRARRRHCDRESRSGPRRPAHGPARTVGGWPWLPADHRHRTRGPQEPRLVDAVARAACPRPPDGTRAPARRRSRRLAAGRAPRARRRRTGSCGSRRRRSAAAGCRSPQNGSVTLEIESDLPVDRRRIGSARPARGRPSLDRSRAARRPRCAR